MQNNNHDIAANCEWCHYDQGLELVGEHVHIANAQVAMEHMVGRCPSCNQTTALARWGKDLRFSYKVLEYKRLMRRSTWVAVYNVICAWCGARTTEPAEINVTVANPVSERFRYDLYACADCGRATALSYLGELRTHCAVRDDVYRALWYLDPE